ncbi:hypothetical protein FOL47_000270 [Perkinsus chesapeaki]|uniref:Hexose transporter 1 n=1 Tax=Perkinsus chesapeaki TaxID=330153 RepID=A0A7J6MN33_PERCH|nr:hypothetical protein FOL47_000270 [Perkinsus chesapeaki]
MASHRITTSDRHAILYVIGSLLAPLAVGFAFGFTGPTIDTMRNTIQTPDGHHIDIGYNNNLHIFSTSTESSLFSAAVTVGAVIGSLVGGPVTELLGRRVTFLLAAPMSACGYILVGVGKVPWVLVLGRGLEGISIGVCSFNGAVYIQEISPSPLRGIFGSCTQLVTVIGMIVIYGLGIVVRTQAGSLDPFATSTTFSDWRILSFICIIPSGLLFIVMFFSSETPRWLATKGRLDDAKLVLQHIRGVPITDPRISAEVEALEEATRKTGDRSATLIDRIKILWSCKRQTIIVIGVPILNQFTGLSAIVFYQTTIFIKSGLHNPNLMSFTVQLTSLAGNILALLFIDRLGRRPLGLISSFGMGMGQLLIAIYFYLDSIGKGTHLAWFSLVGSYLYHFFFSLGLGPLLYLMGAELFPDHARGLASSLSITTTWLFAAVFLLSLDHAIEATSMQAVFFFFTVISFILLIFIWWLLPETKGKTLDEVQSLFHKYHPTIFLTKYSSSNVDKNNA